VFLPRPVAAIFPPHTRIVGYHYGRLSTAKHSCPMPWQNFEVADTDILLACRFPNSKLISGPGKPFLQR